MPPNRFRSGPTASCGLPTKPIAFATPGKSNVGGAYVGGGFERRAAQRIAFFAVGEYAAMSDPSSAVTGKAGVRVGF